LSKGKLVKPQNEKLIEVYKAHGEIEAHIIKAKLESNGIPALLKSSAAPSVHAFVIDGLGEYRVMVPESLAAEARTTLAGDKDV
jgi:hypothetical protein